MEIDGKKIKAALDCSYNPDDVVRPFMAHPFIQDGSLYASEGHFLIRIPLSVVPKSLHSQYVTQEDKPKCKGVIPTDFPLDIVITYDMVKGIIDSLPEEKVISQKAEKCDECDGTGMVTYIYEASDGEEYETEDSCPICDGTGLVDVDDPDNYEMVKKDIIPIKIHDGYIFSRTLIWIEKVMSALELKEIHLRSFVKNEYYCTSSLGVDIVFMAVLATEAEDGGFENKPIKMI